MSTIIQDEANNSYKTSILGAGILWNQESECGSKKYLQKGNSAINTTTNHYTLIAIILLGIIK